MEDQEFWSDKQRAETTLREVSSIKSKLEPIDAVGQQLQDARDILTMAEEEGEDGMTEDVAPGDRGARGYAGRTRDGDVVLRSRR